MAHMLVGMKTAAALFQQQSDHLRELSLPQRRQVEGQPGHPVELIDEAITGNLIIPGIGGGADSRRTKVYTPRHGADPPVAGAGRPAPRALCPG